ncbi:hypothetical protein PQC07_gp019 [Aeromonas phage D3]|uniref:Uncharacterized protein n=2 Tax=Ludhianavirus TaxID=3044751 RepID=A0A514TVD8_9CAUD|nr:hypothetical protein PQC07_gp019 [Aeromonas phage D3]YP_010669004.1 hypothetical protein PQC08_gp019 [Aeromonas phage D6]QDJ96986.1 hypothetical protein D3_0256 [Aeromonas phage D3]QDJ97415.1 hypothetical protein D6_0256 [Aeromonas phage D6]QEP52292.1 hypothetical protein D9_0085 [Aeromonas phage D9]
MNNKTVVFLLIIGLAIIWLGSEHVELEEAVDNLTEVIGQCVNQE